MSIDLDALARRAVACRAWRWMPGMLALRTAHPVVVERSAPSLIPVRLMESITDHEEVAGITLHGELLEAGHVVVNGWHRSSDLIPDLTDPATLGCLLYLVREAWGDGGITTQDLDGYDAYGWVCVVDTARLSPGKEYPHTKHGVTWFDGVTEAEALVVALEALADGCE